MAWCNNTKHKRYFFLFYIQVQEHQISQSFVDQNYNSDRMVLIRNITVASIAVWLHNITFYVAIQVLINYTEE